MSSHFHQKAIIGATCVLFLCVMNSWLIAVLLIFVSLKEACCELRRSKVIILGAGASGIAAARQLQKMGVLDFVIMDALPFVGGLYAAVVVNSNYHC